MFQLILVCTNIKLSLMTELLTLNILSWLFGHHQCTTEVQLRFFGTPVPVLTSELLTLSLVVIQLVLNTQKTHQKIYMMSGTDKSCWLTKKHFSTELKQFLSKQQHTTRKTKEWNSSEAQAVYKKTLISFPDHACVKWPKTALHYHQVS